jgi:hypothetical protein
MSDKHRRRASARKTLLAALLLLGFAQPAHAYMDPGSMSVIVTAILGAIAAVGYTARVYWGRFKAFVGRLLGRSAGEEKRRDGE